MNLVQKQYDYPIGVPKVPFHFFDKLKYEIRNSFDFRFYAEVET